MIVDVSEVAVSAMLAIMFMLGMLAMKMISMGSKDD